MLDIGDLILVCMVVVVALFAYGCATSTVDDMIWHGDEVTTTDRYTELFNDSFSGRVVTKDDGMYIVSAENGTERELDRHWLAKHGQEEI